ncbi:hypothetical protein [Amniculibacterium sp. G2-70]|jgi:hypothetical protein|uniref:hypothetical protein n=1 Tax=Amniculibacterium sp. G2-70 TaxID=2767188 RepID=UPI0016546AD8|nr:hypothetical protein [Amniculibacterium sp. G2-70]
MKKVLVMATICVAGLVSANTGEMEPGKGLKKAIDLKQFVKKAIVDPIPSRFCQWVQSSCGEGGLKCSDEELHYEEIEEFRYLLEDAFCDGEYLSQCIY